MRTGRFSYRAPEAARGQQNWRPKEVSICPIKTILCNNLIKYYHIFGNKN